MAAKNLELGKWGEETALDCITGMGWKILGVNVKVPLGELDIVAIDGRELVIIEVRTRTCGRTMPPECTVGPSKMKKLIRSGSIFVSRNCWEGPWRIDLVAITVRDEAHWDIEHYRNITSEVF
jgi:putative endonuclease